MPATLTAPGQHHSADRDVMDADDFFDFCSRTENQNRTFELIRGEVFEMPSPSITHGVVAVNIATELKVYTRSHPIGFVAGNDAGVILERDPDTVRGPDVALYEFRDGSRAIPRKWSEFPPLIAVEVRSPNDSDRHLALKTSEYLSNGVREVWIVDPDERYVAVHYPDKPPRILVEVASIDSVILPDFSCPLAIIFEGLGTSPE
jgi:Uma2 family endonuclease